MEPRIVFKTSPRPIRLGVLHCACFCRAAFSRRPAVQNEGSFYRDRIIGNSSPALPFGTVNLHKDEIFSTTVDGFYFTKAGFCKTAPGPTIPTQGVKVDTIQESCGENISQQRVNGIRAVSFSPVSTIADHNTHLGFATLGVDIVVHTVAYVSTVVGVNGKPF